MQLNVNVWLLYTVLHSTKDLNSRLARWAIQLAAYDIDIQHRSGSENDPPDALSRYPIDAAVNDDNDDNELSSSIISSLSCHFLNDNSIDFLSALPSNPGSLLLIDYFRHNSLQSHSLPIPISLPSISIARPLSSDISVANIHFADNINLYEQIPRLHRVIDGALYRIFRSRCSIEGQQPITSLSSERLLLFIPASEIPRLLQIAHDHATVAHPGRRKTLSQLTSRVYWPHMRRDVISYVRACTLCQQYKLTNQKPGGFMKPIIVSQPWHTVGIDITGPLSKTRRANTIAQLFLGEVICRFGFPVRIISDNEVQFLSKVFIQLCHILGIHHQRTPLYHPQSNLSECINRTLKPILASLAHNDSKSWDVKLYQIAFALRTAPSESTENSPAFLMFGRHPRQPIDLLLPPPAISDNLPSEENLSDY
ncbi:unnamed protein product [Rotaria sp. Silwood1]|nr:unnamed protein product [Rotaria sp. Silwood1]